MHDADAATRAGRETEEAAAAWLATLDDEALRQAQLPSPLEDADADAERVRWFYTPTDHGGLALREQSPTQQQLAMRLLASGMSRAGYATVATVLGLENILDQVEGWGTHWGRERGRDPGLYWVRVFGRPGDRVWGWRFGGHHISVNLLVVDGRVVSSTPSFIGTDPATAPILGGVSRPLGGPEETARDLMLSLDADQRRSALLHPRAISDIVSGNRVTVSPGDTMMHMQDLWRGKFTDPDLDERVEDVDRRAEAASQYTGLDHDTMAIPQVPAGVCAADLDGAQRDLLRRLIAMYTGRAPAAIAEQHTDAYAIEANLDEVAFGWAGSAAAGEPHYYRLHGPRILVEYDNTQRDANHAHSVWRDPVADFGLDILRAHRRSAH